MSNSQKMNEITDQGTDVPEEWVLCSLGEIAVAQSGFACGEKNVQDGLIHLRMNNISENCFLNMELIRKVPLDNKIDKYLLKKGDLLFCHTNSSKLVGKNAIFNLNGDYTYSNHLTRLRVNPSIISPNWLWCILTIYWKEGRFEKECKNWVNQSALPHDKLVKLSIPLPPITEQHFIVDRVETLLEHVKKAKESLDKIPLTMKRFRQAALKKAFSGELTAEWRKQQQDLEPAAELLKRIQEERERRQKQFKKKIKQETELLDSSELPELPEGWVWTRLEDLSLNPKQDIVDGPFGSDMKASEYRYDGIPIIRLQNIDRNRFIRKNIKFISTDKAKELSRHSFSRGDIVITKLGDPLGEACIVPDEIEWGIVVPDVVRISVAQQFVNKFFISYLLNSEIVIKQLIEKTKGTTRPRVNLNHIRELEIFLPSLPEQQEIVRRIEALFKFADETEKNAGDARRRVELMTQSILARAFRGELSADFREAVKNWKNLDAEAHGRYVFVLPEEEREKVLNADEFPMEPAGRLLERIGGERAKMEGSKRNTKARVRKG